jgi:hypothetical protein
MLTGDRRDRLEGTMQRLTIRRFDIIRTANVVAVLYALFFAVFGLIFLVPFAFIGIAGSTRADNATGLAAAGLVGGLVLYVLIVAFYTFIGWIATAIVCAFYNAVAGRMGGIRFVVDVEGQAGAAPGYPAYPAPYAGAAYPAPAPQPNPPGYGAPPAPPA